MKLLIAALILSISSLCEAATSDGKMTGNDLNEFYNSGELGKGSASMYVIGILHGQYIGAFRIKENNERLYETTVKPYLICMPEGSNFAQANDIVEKFVKDNPSKRHLAAYVIVYMALESWRCQ